MLGFTSEGKLPIAYLSDGAVVTLKSVSINLDLFLAAPRKAVGKLASTAVDLTFARVSGWSVTARRAPPLKMTLAARKAVTATKGPTAVDLLVSPLKNVGKTVFPGGYPQIDAFLVKRALTVGKLAAPPVRLTFVRIAGWAITARRAPPVGLTFLAVKAVTRTLAAALVSVRATLVRNAGLYAAPLLSLLVSRYTAFVCRAELSDGFSTTGETASGWSDATEDSTTFTPESEAADPWSTQTEETDSSTEAANEPSNSCGGS